MVNTCRIPGAKPRHRPYGTYCSPGCSGVWKFPQRHWSQACTWVCNCEMQSWSLLHISSFLFSVIHGNFHYSLHKEAETQSTFSIQSNCEQGSCDLLKPFISLCSDCSKILTNNVILSPQTYKFWGENCCLFPLYK
jgi:hypothetical protein